MPFLILSSDARYWDGNDWTDNEAQAQLYRAPAHADPWRAAEEARQRLAGETGAPCFLIATARGKEAGHA